MKKGKSSLNGISNLLIIFPFIGLFLILGCQKDDVIDDIPPEPMGYIDTTMMVDIGGYHLYAETKGEGSTTIVFENGLGDNFEVWKEGVYDGLGNDYQLIIYNRANYAPSESPTNSVGRNINQIAKELKVVIDSLAQNETVILVGHSLGGPIIRSFVNQFPDKVEAMLFVDPSHEGDYTASSVEEFEYEMLNNVIPVIPETYALRSEIEQLVENWEIMNGLPNLPDIPVTVLTAMSLIDDTEEERQIWYELHESLGEGVTEFTHLSSAEVSHHIQVDDPSMVINAIIGLID